MSLKMSKSILHNTFVLYFVFTLAIVNLSTFLMYYDYMSASMLFLSGALTSFFSKNMTVIIMVSIAVANVYCFGSRLESFRSDFEIETKDEEMM